MVFDNYYNRNVQEYFGNPNIPPPSGGTSYPENTGGLYKEISLPKKEESDPLSPKNIGMSAGVMQSIHASVEAAMKQGARKVEIAFFGQGKGNRQGLTPDDFTLQERRDVRELTKVNEMEVSTHASANISGLAGLTGGEGGGGGTFSENYRKQALDEVKRAINFAADASTGGAIVVHTGEFPRSIHQLTKDKDVKFEAFEEEEKEKVHYLVDEVSGQLISSVKENQEVWLPVQKYDDNGNPDYLKKSDGTLEEDEFFKERGKSKPIPVYKYDSKGNIKMEKFTYKDWEERELKNSPLMTKDDLVKKFFNIQREAEVQHSLGSAKEFESLYSQSLKRREKLLKAMEFYKKVWEKTPEKDRWKLNMREMIPQDIAQVIPEDQKNPIEFIQDQINDTERKMAYGREIAISGRRQAHQMLDQVDHAKTIYEYGSDKTFTSVAEAGIFAMEKTKQAGDAISQPLFIAPENWSPEQYGAHPDELKEIVEKSREKMAKMLVHSRGMSQSDATRAAQDHIKATLDVGHLNFWRKYFKADPNKSSEANEKQFKNWLVKKTKDLADKGIIGHVHLADNFGFHDDHLTLGGGNAPIKEMVDVLKKAGLRDMIVEPGSTNFETSFRDSLGFLGSPVYRFSGTEEITGPRGWRDIHNAYFGYVRPPYQVVGSYAPWTNENQGWTPWSQLPFE